MGSNPEDYDTSMVLLFKTRRYSYMRYIKHHKMSETPQDEHFNSTMAV